jgi:fermentation-respiration switch protein FrsA (DUF1100 family)
MARRDWRYWRNLSLFGLCALVVGVLGILFHFTYQGAMGYVHPRRLPREADETPARFGVPYRDVTLVTGDGLELSAWYTTPENGAVILVAHGFGGKRWDEMHALFARHGYGVLSWDFRAHGESEGELCTLGYHEALDVEAALDFVLAQPDVEWVGAWGGSMGGAATIEAATRRGEIEALVIDSTFYSLEAVLELAVSVPALRPAIRFLAEREAGITADQVRPVDRIGLLSPRPVFLIQGEADSIAPPDSARRLYDAAGEPRTLWTEPGVEHVEMYKAFPQEYERRVIAFFDRARLGED